jgi:hypothetical protein
MLTRRILLPLLATPMLATPMPAQAQGQAPRPAEERQPPADDRLPPRGTPTGRIGGATRGQGGIALDLLAPERGAGQTSSASTALYYRLTGPAGRPLRATLSLATQARPVIDVSLPPPPGAGVHGFPLPSSAQLVPGAIYVWSVTLAVDPRAPSRDIVASALLVHTPAEATLRRAIEAAPPRERVAMWERAGFFYDAVVAAIAVRAQDQGTALAALLRSVNL